MSLAFRFARLFAGTLVCAAASVAGAQTATVNVAHSFTAAEGDTPAAPLIQASDGNFYGTTYNDGTSFAGSVLKLTPGSGGAPGTLTVLHAFDPNKEGYVSNDNNALTEGPDGNLYGTTASGGVNGNGCFYQINLAKGTFKVVYSFGTEAYTPATLTLGSDGNFYTTTLYGGDNANGSILQITPAGVVTLLYDFPGGTGGSNPTTPLLETAPMTFYGADLQGDGSIFKAVVINGAVTFSDQFDFSATNGSFPNLPLIAYSDGTLYSGTNQGGAGTNGGQGTIFRFDPVAQKVSTLYDLSTNIPTTGQYPDALVLGSDGNFYFPTIDSSTDCSASINQITPAGKLTTVYDGNTAGARSTEAVYCPASQMVQAADGTYYGTSQDGGANNLGDIYQMVPAAAQKAPVQLSASTTAPVTGTPFTISYTVTNAFSLTAQQCYAFVQGGATGAGSWTGKQAGKQGASGFKGSASVTATAAGTYTYALTCGGTESGFLTLTVGQGSTQKTSSSISVTSINSPNYGGTISIALQVDSASNSGPAPTGTVSFTAGSTALGTVTLVPGSGSVSTATLSVKDTLPNGKYNLSIAYSGDTNYNSSVAGASLTIAAIPSDVTINSVSTPQYGGTALVNLTVSSANGSGPTPTGRITVTVGTAGSVGFTLTGGSGDSLTATASFQVELAPGKYTLSVVYSGDNSYAPASAGSNLTETADVTTTFLYAPSYVKTGDAATFYYKVSGSYATPAGTVQLLFDGNPIGSPVTLGPSALYTNTAVASLVAPGSLTSQAPPSSTVPYGVSARYTPANADFVSSATAGTSNLYLVTNADAGMSFAISPAQVNYNGSVTLSSQATGKGSFSGGHFLYTVGNDVIASVAVNSLGQSDSNITVPLGTIVPVGTYTGVSTYSGDPLNSATSRTATLTVEALYASATPNPVTAGNPITLTAYAAPNPGSTAYPTGTVHFAITPPGASSPALKFALPLGSNGQASTGPMATTGFPAGTYAVAVTYDGDATHGAAAYNFNVTIQ